MKSKLWNQFIAGNWKVCIIESLAHNLYAIFVADETCNTFTAVTNKNRKLENLK